jgi:two-component system clock-associated histidine kinase SasA
VPAAGDAHHPTTTLQAETGGDAPARQPLRLLLVATRHHLATPDLRNLIAFLRSEESGFDISLEVADPARYPELLELHRLVATPALVKLEPPPRQVFAGTTISLQVRHWVPRWKQVEVVSSLGMTLRPAEMDGSRTQREVQLEDQLLVLRQENETLIERLGVQERLLRMVAHELRTPLTAAKLALQSHSLGQIDEPRFRDLLNRRLDDIEELSRDLLEVGTTRWEALFNPQRLALGQVAAEAILELEKLWVGRKLELVTDVPADLPDVYADQRRMRQVLLNLLENAFKFTPEGGRVSLTLLHRTSQWVQASVCDTGPGIPTGNSSGSSRTGFACPRPPAPRRDSVWVSRYAAASPKCMAAASGWCRSLGRGPASTSPCPYGRARAPRHPPRSNPNRACPRLDEWSPRPEPSFSSAPVLHRFDRSS